MQCLADRNLPVPTLPKPTSTLPTFAPPPFTAFSPSAPNADSSDPSPWSLPRQEGLKALNIDLSWAPITLTKPIPVDRLADVEGLLLADDETSESRRGGRTEVEGSVIGYRLRDEDGREGQEGEGDGESEDETVRIMSPSVSPPPSPARPRNRSGSVSSGLAVSAVHPEEAGLEVASTVGIGGPRATEEDYISAIELDDHQPLAAVEAANDAPPIEEFAGLPSSIPEPPSPCEELVAFDSPSVELSAFEGHRLSPIAEAETPREPAMEKPDGSFGPGMEMDVGWREFPSSETEEVHLVGDATIQGAMDVDDPVAEAAVNELPSSQNDFLPKTTSASGPIPTTRIDMILPDPSSDQGGDVDPRPFKLVDRPSLTRSSQTATAHADAVTAQQDPLDVVVPTRPSVSSPHAHAIPSQSSSKSSHSGSSDVFLPPRQDVASSLRDFAAARWNYHRQDPPSNPLPTPPSAQPPRQLKQASPAVDAPTVVPPPPDSITGIFRVPAHNAAQVCQIGEATCSMRLIQNRRLHRELALRFDLHEATDGTEPDDFVISEPDLVVGPSTGIVFLRLNALPRAVSRPEELEAIDSDSPLDRERPEAAFSTVYRLAQSFDRLLLVFEAYPSKPTSGPLPYPYTPPIVKALAELSGVVREYVEYLEKEDVRLVCSIAVAESPQAAADLATGWVATLGQ